MGEDIPERVTAFGDSARLNHRRQIELVKGRGTGTAGRYAVVVILKTPPDGMRRAAFLISRRFSLLSVERNRARRLFRETYRLLFERLDTSWILFIPRRAIKRASQQEVQREVEGVCRKMGILLPASTAPTTSTEPTS